MKLSPTCRAQVISLLPILPYHEIAQRFGISPSYVGKIAQEVGFRRRPQATPERDRMICWQFGEGCSIAELAHQHALSPARIRAILRSSGYQGKRGRKPHKPLITAVEQPLVLHKDRAFLHTIMV